MTARAVCIGLFASIVINLAMAYNDFYLKNNLLIGNHFPMSSLALLLVFVLVINPALRRFVRARPFSSGELLLMWGMIGVAGGIGSAGLMRYLPSWILAPAYFATPANGFSEYILANLPGWMMVSKDSEDPAVVWFMEGLPRGETVPWGRWIAPLAIWALFALLLYGVIFSLSAVLFRQWDENERLIFPIVHLPAELTREPEQGRLLNAFLKNRALWWGTGIAFLVVGLNSLRIFLPGLPLIPQSWSTWGLFPDRPWSQFHLHSANLYFSVVGLTFLLTTEMSLSLWAFFVLYRLSFVYIAWLGAGATGFFGEWSVNVTTFEAAGCVIVLAGFILWTARKAIGEWLRRAAKGRDDPAREPMPPRWALALTVLGFTGTLAWLVHAGVDWWAALIAMAVFIAVVLVLTRLVAEAGLLFVQSNVLPQELLMGLFPASWLSGPTLNVLMIHKAVHMHDLRETLMPYLVNGMKACGRAGVSLRRVLLVFGLCVLAALAVSAYGRISTNYKYGAMNMDYWGSVSSLQWWMGNSANYLKNPPQYESVKIGDIAVMPVRLAHITIGGLVSAGLLALRARYLWWPLHPFGLVMVGVWAMRLIWFSIFLGWLAKVLVMRFGGSQTYRRALPFFLGLALGDMAATAIFAVVSLITGVPVTPVLPR